MSEARHGAGRARRWAAAAAAASAAVGAPFVALLCRQALIRHFGHELPTYFLFYPAVMIAAIFFGLWAGLLSTVTAALLVAFWILPPPGIGVGDPGDAVALTIFVIGGTFMSVVAELYRRNRQKAAAYEQREALRASEARNQRLLAEAEERRKLSAAVQAERQRFESVLDVLPAYVVLLAHDYRVPFANRYFEERFGKSEGRRCYEYLFQRNQPCENCESFKVVTTHAPHAWEWVGPDGRTYDIHDFPFTDSDGTPLILEVGIDITERKAAEVKLRQLNRSLRAVSDSNQALLHAADEQSLLDAVCRILVDRCGYALAWVGYPVTDAGKTVRPVAMAGVATDYVATVSVTWSDVERGRGPTGTAIRTGQIIAIDDTVSDPRFAPWRQRALAKGFRSCVCLPVDLGEPIPAGLSIYATTVGAFPAEELALLAELAQDLGFGIRALRARAQRERAERKLQEQEFYTRSLIEASLDPLVTISREGKITDVNRATEEVTGVGREQLIGSDFCDCFSDPEKAHAGYQQVFANGVVHDYPLAIRHTSGRLTEVLYNATVFRNQKGEVEGVFAAARDITERQRAESELAQRLAQQAALAELSQMAVRGGDLPALLDRAVALLAETLDVEYCKVLELLPGGLEVLLRAGVGWKTGLVGTARVSTGRDSQAGYTLLSDAPVVVDDLRAETRFSGPPLLHEHGVISGMSVVIRLAAGAWGVLGAHTRRHRGFSPGDVRLLQAVASVLGQAIERDRAEQRIRAQQQYARSLLEASLDPLVTISREGKITDVNQATEAFTGLSREELIGSDFCSYFTEPDNAKAGYQRVFADGFVTDYPLALRHASGRVADVLYNATVFRNEAGEIEGVFAAARDITGRLRAERELKRYMAELQRSNAELQDFASIASHDLQEPLRKVMAFGDRLHEHSAAALDELSQDYLARMNNAALRMSTLIEDLLRYSRVSSRAQPFQPVDLNKVLAEVLVDLEARLQESGGRVEAGTLPKLMADRTQMAQLLQNLLGNAIKFRRPGVPPRIVVESSPLPDQRWEIRIRDNGIGFKQEYAERIFRPFQRLHGRDEYEGSGMGLAICRKIVARHGGSIAAESQPGQGSAFVVILGNRPEERSEPCSDPENRSASCSPKMMMTITS